jgi:hypothetical protein
LFTAAGEEGWLDPNVNAGAGAAEGAVNENGVGWLNVDGLLGWEPACGEDAWLNGLLVTGALKPNAGPVGGVVDWKENGLAVELFGCSTSGTFVPKALKDWFWPKPKPIVGFCSILFSVFCAKKFVDGALNEKGVVLFWPACRNVDSADGPGVNEKSEGLGSVVGFPFSCISLVGLSSMRRSWSSFLGGVTARAIGALAAPKMKGLVIGSFATAGVVDNPDVGAGATGAPKLNNGFLSAPAGGVLGAAP